MLCKRYQDKERERACRDALAQMTAYFDWRDV